MVIFILRKESFAMLNLSSSFDLSSRPKRRKAVSAVLRLLSGIRDAEQSYRDRIPDNFANSADDADLSIDQLSDAIDSLADAY